MLDTTAYGWHLPELATTGSVTVSTGSATKRASAVSAGSNFIPPGTVGVLGSGTLMNYNPVLVDYTDGELFLGQRTQAPSDAPERPISSG